MLLLLDRERERERATNMTSLLHFKNIPNQMLSGVSGTALDFVSKESANRYLLELDGKFLSNLNELCDNLPILTADQLKELDNIETSGIPSSTSNQTKQHVTKFKKFLLSEGLSDNIEEVPAPYLNDYLRLFYAKIRKEDGTLFAPASLVSTIVCKK